MQNVDKSKGGLCELLSSRHMIYFQGNFHLKQGVHHNYTDAMQCLIHGFLQHNKSINDLIINTSSM